MRSCVRSVVGNSRSNGRAHEVARYNNARSNSLTTFARVMYLARYARSAYFTNVFLTVQDLQLAVGGVWGGSPLLACTFARILSSKFEFNIIDSCYIINASPKARLN